MKKTIHAHLSKTYGLSRLPVVLNFPKSIDPQVSVRKWPTSEFTLKVIGEGAQTNLCLDTPDRTEVLASFKTEADARAALDELYDKLLNRRVRTFFKWTGYVFVGLVVWAAVLFAYGIFVTFGPAAAQSARTSMESSVAGFTQMEFPDQDQTQQASTPTFQQLGENPMGALTEQALANIQRQAAIEQEKIAQQLQTQAQANSNQQGQTQPQSYVEDINETFAAAKK